MVYRDTALAQPGCNPLESNESIVASVSDVLSEYWEDPTHNTHYLATTASGLVHPGNKLLPLKATGLQSLAKSPPVRSVSTVSSSILFGMSATSSTCCEPSLKLNSTSNSRFLHWHGYPRHGYPVCDSMGKRQWSSVRALQHPEYVFP